MCPSACYMILFTFAPNEIVSSNPSALIRLAYTQIYPIFIQINVCVFIWSAFQTIVSAMSTLIPPVPLANAANQPRIDYIKSIAPLSDFDYTEVRIGTPEPADHLLWKMLFYSGPCHRAMSMSEMRELDLGNGFNGARLHACRWREMLVLSCLNVSWEIQYMKFSHWPGVIPNYLCFCCNDLT